MALQSSWLYIQVQAQLYLLLVSKTNPIKVSPLPHHSSVITIHYTRFQHSSSFSYQQTLETREHQPPKMAGIGSDSPPPTVLKRSKVEGSMPNIPREIVIDILSRLPVKTLSKFRCVSKSWRSLISDPIFVKEHLQVTTRDDNCICTNHRVIMNCEDSVFNFISFSLHSVFNELCLDTMELDDPFENPGQSYNVVVVGSCNGLLCIAIGMGIVYLWNPTTRQSRRLPDSGFRVPKEGYITYGLGFDCSTDDYKVVAVAVLDCSRSGINKEKCVKVYSLRANSWRRTENFLYGMPYEEPGLLVGGALNWHVVRGGRIPDDVFENVDSITDLRSSWVLSTIFGLDLATETYREVPQPVYQFHPSDLFLGVLGGNHSILASYNRSCHDLLVSKEYGTGEFWTRLITFQEDIYPCISLYRSENGQILLEHSSALHLYNPETSTSRFLLYGGPRLCLNSEIYLESLVSPNAEDMV